ncbi:putative AC transposase [Bienertia sinuspersici]
MKMARDILAIPLSTIVFKSAFRKGGRILDSFHTSLTARMAEGRICAQNWKIWKKVCLMYLFYIFLFVIIYNYM